ncbi:MAG: DUF domain-containing protein [Methanosarcinales archaeon]|nr:MAG: DUF domain-containing protein [Methanosarcinales archaeon]
MTQRGIIEALSQDSPLREFFSLFPLAQQPKVDVPAAVNAVVEELWQHSLKHLRGHPYCLGIDESDMRLCGGRSILQVHVYSALVEKPVLVSIVANNAKANHQMLCDALTNVANFLGPENLAGVAADNAAVCTAAVRKLQETHGQVQQIKCIAHSVQLCLRRVLEEWAPLAAFMDGMAVLTAKAQSLPRKRLANAFGLECSEWDFCRTRWTSATAPLLNLLQPSTWENVYKFVQELRKGARCHDGVEAALGAVEAFIRDPTNLLRVTALAHVNSKVNKVVASSSCNFPPEQLYEELSLLMSTLTTACDSPYDLILPATEDGAWKALIQLFERMAAEESGVPTTTVSSSATTRRPSRTAGAARGGAATARAKSEAHISSGSRARTPRASAAAAEASASATIEQAHSSSATLPLPTLRVAGGTKTSSTSLDVGIKRRREVGTSPRRSPRPHTAVERSDSYSESELHAAGNPLWEAVDTLVDDAVETVAEEIRRWGAAALNTYNEHIQPMRHILRARFALYPWIPSTYDVIAELDALGWLPKDKRERTKLEEEVHSYISSRDDKAWIRRPKTHESLRSFWHVMQSRIPNLASLALRVLSLPVSSVAIERGFSIQTHVMRRLRGSRVYLQTAINEIFLQSYGNKYLAELTKRTLAEARKALKALDFATVELPNILDPPSPRLVAAEEVAEMDELNSSMISLIEDYDDESDATSTSTTETDHPILL